ncbi:MAG: hypothetical protein DSM106950_14340 [Stigonema ocellatum SAG 48.90 = DSM 106950]|nr:hypothetical protein [Stigonema ocellatum SAG 48.90 = DSM 106950]
MGSNDNNLIMLTLYIIGVSYVFNQMVESIDDQVQIEFNKASVEEQLKGQNLQDKIGISFSLKTMYTIEDPKELSIGIENKSQDIAIYVDWDNSAFEEFDGASRRVIRKSPDVTRDLAVPQIPSLIVPGKTLRETVASESVFQLDKESGIYKANLPIANIIKLKSGSGGQKKQYSEFSNRKRNFEFSLDLVLRIAETNLGIAPGSKAPPLCFVKCPFTVKKLSWTYALPWNRRR